MSLLDLTSLESVVDVADGEVRRVQKVEWESDFPSLVVDAEGNPTAQWRLSDIPIEANPTLRIQDFKRPRDRTPAPPSLIELPRRELVPGTSIVDYVFDRSSEVQEGLKLSGRTSSKIRF